MEQEQTEKKASESEVLFPDREIYGVKVRPWNYDQFIAVLPLIVGIQKGLKDQKIGLEDLKEDNKEMIIEVLLRVAPILPVKELVSKTTGDSLAEVGKWEFDKTICIFLVILIQNAARVKNFFGLGLAAIQAMKMVS